MSTSPSLSRWRKLAEGNFRCAKERLRKEVPRVERKPLKDIEIAIVGNIDDVEMKAAQLQSDLQSIIQVWKKSTNNHTRYQKVTCMAAQWFRATFPFVKLILSVAKDDESAINPYKLLFSGLLKLATIAEQSSERAAAIDETLDFISNELNNIQVTKTFITDATPTHLENARCTALDLSSAICKFLAIAIRAFGRGPFRHRMASIFKGHAPLKKLRDKVSGARVDYIAALNIQVVKTIYIGTKNTGTSLSTANEESPAVPESQFADSIMDNPRHVPRLAPSEGYPDPDSHYMHGSESQSSPIDSTFSSEERIGEARQTVSAPSQMSPATGALENFLRKECPELMKNSRLKTSLECMESTHWTVGEDKTIGHITWIDAGGIGEVFQMYNKTTQQYFARKIIRQSSRHDRQKINQIIQNEMRMIEKARAEGGNENIINVLKHGWLNVERDYYIDMELCIINLEDYILGDVKSIYGIQNYFDPKSCGGELECLSLWSIMTSISKALEFIHSQNELHRDLKPRNVLLSQDDATWKLTDFGLTSEGDSKEAYLTSQARGTEGYRGPEAFSRKVSMKSDIWGLGCILYELLSGGRKAFKSDWDMFHYAQDKSTLEIPSLPDETDERLKSCVPQIVHRTLEIDYWKRPSPKDLLGMFTSLSEPTTELYVLNSEVIGQRLRIYPDSPSWKSVKWKQYCIVCMSVVSFPQTSSDDESTVYACKCPNSASTCIGWAFLVDKVDI